jgi:demethylmenaquinone methyltransferase/2-methoxy-6-polyprenyl-1,4-benzoquinol methylase
MVSRIPSVDGAQVLDVATGTGLVARELTERGHRVIGIDQSEGMLARASTRRKGGGSLQLALGCAERLPFGSETFGAVTFTYLLRYVDEPASVLSELSRVLAPGGTLANLEFHVPPNPVWRAAWRVYTGVALPVAGAAISRDWYDVGRFLGPSIRDFYERHPLEEQLRMWREAGIVDLQVRLMSLGGGIVISGRKSG